MNTYDTTNRTFSRRPALTGPSRGTRPPDADRRPGGRHVSPGRWMTACFGTLVALGPVLMAGQAERPELTDAAITAAVERGLWNDEIVSGSAIQVATVDGAVTLSGEVDSLLERDRAADVATSVRGVRTVVNTLEPKPTTRSDRAIRQDIAQALSFDPLAERLEVSIAVSEGVVHLTGEVESWPERKLAADVAKSVVGVVEIDNGIRIGGSPVVRTDAELAEDIRRRLRMDVQIESDRIRVAVADGEASLSGAVASAFERQRANALARIIGVTAVDVTDLSVDESLDDDTERGATEAVSDRDVAEAVRFALRLDPRIQRFGVDVDVRIGVLTLSGIVDNLAARRAAEEDAYNTTGVREVRNLLKVQPVDRVPDAELADAVARALELNPFFRPLVEPSIRARGGTVYLGGVVGSHFERDWAETIATGVAGVVDVVNGLDVRVPVPRADHEVEATIEELLVWNAWVDARRIEVGVARGIVTLSGFVPSNLEREHAERLAYQGGAVDVRNRLRLSTPATPARHHPRDRVGGDEADVA